MFDACAQALKPAKDTAPGQHGRRCIRHPSEGYDRSRSSREFPQCLRLHDGGDLSADLDGLADDLCRRSRRVLALNMVFFLHMILLDSDTGLSMSSERPRSSRKPGEPISRAPRHLLVAGNWRVPCDSHTEASPSASIAQDAIPGRGNHPFGPRRPQESAALHDAHPERTFAIAEQFGDMSVMFQRAVGSTGEINFGATSVTAPTAASASGS